jgi:hypothetical protein
MKDSYFKDRDCSLVPTGNTQLKRTEPEKQMSKVDRKILHLRVRSSQVKIKLFLYQIVEAHRFVRHRGCNIF